MLVSKNHLQKFFIIAASRSTVVNSSQLSWPLELVTQIRKRWKPNFERKLKSNNVAPENAGGESQKGTEDR